MISFVLFAGDSGPAPFHTQWTLLCLDFAHILSLYLNRSYSYLKNVKLCANMFVKNVFTSDTEYQPGEFSLPHFKTLCLFLGPKKILLVVQNELKGLTCVKIGRH